MLFQIHQRFIPTFSATFLLAILEKKVTVTFGSISNLHIENVFELQGGCKNWLIWKVIVLTFDVPYLLLGILYSFVCCLGQIA